MENFKNKENNINEVFCLCESESCTKRDEVNLFLKIKKASQVDEASFESITDSWDSFDVDDFMPERELVEDYTCDLDLEFNPDWLLWETEIMYV